MKRSIPADESVPTSKRVCIESVFSDSLPFEIVSHIVSFLRGDLLSAINFATSCKAHYEKFAEKTSDHTKTILSYDLSVAVFGGPGIRCPCTKQRYASEICPIYVTCHEQRQLAYVAIKIVLNQIANCAYDTNKHLEDMLGKSDLMTVKKQKRLMRSVIEKICRHNFVDLFAHRLKRIFDASRLSSKHIQFSKNFNPSHYVDEYRCMIQKLGCGDIGLMTFNVKYVCEDTRLVLQASHRGDPIAPYQHWFYLLRRHGARDTPISPFIFAYGIFFEDGEYTKASLLRPFVDTANAVLQALYEFVDTVIDDMSNSIAESIRAHKRFSTPFREALDFIAGDNLVNILNWFYTKCIIEQSYSMHDHVEKINGLTIAITFSDQCRNGLTLRDVFHPYTLGHVPCEFGSESCRISRRQLLLPLITLRRMGKLVIPDPKDVTPLERDILKSCIVGNDV